MIRAARIALALGAAVLLAGLSARPAAAFYDNGFDGAPGAFLVSADYARLEQGDDTTRYATISADGRYVAIETFSRNFFADDDPDPAGAYRAGGIFRFDLQTRALAKVADGNLFKESDGSFLRRGAAGPSISADGRYLVFSTAQQLVAADENHNIDVYRRDMSVALPAGGACTASTPPPCAFELVSARDGSDEPAQYAAPGFPAGGGDPGAEVTRGAAISADGRRVVFRTDAGSDLPAAPGLETPAGQLFVRDLQSKTTQLITSTRDPVSGQMTGEPAGGAVGAAISADGTTVAWTGTNAPAQTRFLAGENKDAGFSYYLWRRIADGAGAPTRRITGLADPDDPVCRAAEEANPGMSTNFDATSTGPCYGPLTEQESLRADISAQVPALSADGYTVAFLTGSGPRPVSFTGPGLDLWVSSMLPGLTRKQAGTELTRDTASPDPAVSSPISSVAISADGRYLALTSSRTQFTLPALNFISTPRPVVGPAELYLIDRAAGTIERALHSASGGDIGGSVLDGTSISADGARIAFASFAGNLFAGDANQRADAFVATRESEAQVEAVSEEGEGGASSIERFGSGPRIKVRLRSVHGGVAVLGVAVPVPGDILASAKTIAGSHGGSRKAASGGSRAKRKGEVRVTLRLRRSLRAALRDGKVRTRARVSFVPSAGGRRLNASLRVTFFSRSSPDRHK